MVARQGTLKTLLVTLLLSLASVAAHAADNASFTTRGFPYDAFDRLPHTVIERGGGTLKVAFAPGDPGMAQKTWLDWVAKSADAIVAYYGRFPVGAARLLLVPGEGRGISHGQAFGYRGPAIRLMIGRGSNAEDLARDWKLVHEMVHLALPDLLRRYNWLSEGLAVYVESIARVQAGHLPAAQIWREFARDMPKGLPGPGDEGLDHTPTWGRTYWGGAIFCLLADIEIRQRTGNRRGLQHALRAILAQDGNIAVDWPMERVLDVGDAATGTRVLHELYQRMRATPVSTDLDTLWQRLGVKAGGGAVAFDDAAALAAVRRAITAPWSAASSAG